MKNYFILVMCIFLSQAATLAQKDSVNHTVTTSTKVSTQKITIEQEQWLRQNYQHIVSMKKDSARTEIRKSFPSVSNTIVEAMIGRANKLLQADKQKHQVQVQQMMRSLTTQKNTLTKEIAEKEKELKKTKDPSGIKILKDEIIILKNKIKELDKEIKYLHDSK